jgi:two-component system, chemotaxis family, protein-glutamate methylesterase/glutaminase
MSVRVLIVDDSALVRQLLAEILSRDPEIEVLGSAPDPYVARDRIKELKPDVLTLDVEMPRMDGLTFLENLMRLHPLPVLMVSSLTEAGAEVTLQALELGAVDFVTKPRVDVAHGLQEYAEQLVAKVKAVARARPCGRGGARSPAPATPSRHSADAVLPRAAPPAYRTTDRLIAIGASTGGTEAIREVLEGMPADAPAVVIAQHIPAAFSRPFAQRMDRHSAMSVSEARDGQPIVAGCAYVAPGDCHLLVQRDGAHFRCRLSDGPPVNRHRPSVDVLFRSVAQAAGANAVAAILTGMGDDGARGLLEMRQAGAHTVAQDEASSVVWGMPGAAVKLGAAAQVLPLGRVAAELLRLAAGARAA